MASLLPEQKLAKALADNCADSRLNETALAHVMGRQHRDIQARFWNILVAYIYSMSHYYELGYFPHDNYEIARLSKKIKDLAFADEYTTVKYERYGDYEAINDVVNLSIFDMA